MRDADYMPPEDRGCAGPLRWETVVRSHAVADDVMRELADALRDALRYMPDEACDSGECDACWDTCRAMVDADSYRRALARVDALLGGE